MTADQREPHRLLTTLWDRYVTQPPQSPFQNGKFLDHGEETGWGIQNDGVLIRFTKESPTAGDPPYRLSRDIRTLVNGYPVFDHIFQHFYGSPGPDNEQAEYYTIPSVPTLNTFRREVFDGLPVAGIDLVQTRKRNENEFGETPVLPYVDKLVPGRKLVASSQQGTQLHDVLAHWLMAATTEDREFVVFENLDRQSTNIRRRFGKDVYRSYRARLGSAFDSFSGTGTLTTEDTLPDVCLEELTYNYRPKNVVIMATPIPEPVLEASRQIIQVYNRNDVNSIGQTRDEYYGEIKNRLRQTPWIPPVALAA